MPTVCQGSDAISVAFGSQGVEDSRAQTQPCTAPAPCLQTQGPPSTQIAASYNLQQPGPAAECLFLEVFAGSARLSKSFQALGYQTISVDSRAHKEAKILKLDLLQPSSMQLVMRLLHTRRVVWVHLAPPCSTSSAARLIRRSRWDPAPLRSWCHPQGLPTLSVANRTRVNTANQLYQVTADIVLECERLGIWWSVENPSSSMFWITKPMKLVHKACPRMHTVVFDHCTYGGARAKRTAVWSSCAAIVELASLCHPSFSHVHLPWGRTANGWATADETAYPRRLCSFWAAIAHRHAVVVGRVLPAASASETCALTGGSHQEAVEQRLRLGLFPRGTEVPDMLDPFAERKWVRVPDWLDRQQFVPGRRIDVQGMGLVKGSRTLQVQVLEGVLWAEVGQPMQPEAFLGKVACTTHPQNKLPPLPEVLQDAVFKLTHRPLREAQNLRCQRLKSLIARAQELHEEERLLHENLAPHLKRILKPKRLLLLREVLRALDFPDSTLVDDIVQGFRITGWLPDTGVRPLKVCPPTLSREDVWGARDARNREIWESVGPRTDQRLDQALWEQTLKECSKGWAVLEPGHMQAPTSCVLGKRFPVEQPDKVRPIDDTSISHVNMTLGCEEKVVVMTVSTTVALALHFMASAKEPVDLDGRTFDLRSAYKQLGIHTEDLPFAKVAVYSPEHRRPVVLALQALPFGATGSVHGFIRCSLALWWVLVKFLVIPSTHFYDDFTSVTLRQDAENVKGAFQLLMSILGWDLATDGAKAKDFAQHFVSLGIVFSLPREVHQVVAVANAEEKCAQVVEVCRKALTSGRMSAREATAFASRLRWLDGQIFGRAGRRALQCILQHGNPPSCSKQRPLTTQLRSALEWVLETFPKAAPRLFRLPGAKEFHLFTDGAVEAEASGIGAVLCNERAVPSEWMGSSIPHNLLRAWRKHSKHPVIQSELLGAAAALDLWGPRLAHSCVTLWLDNDPARHGLIAGTAHPDSSASLVHAVTLLEAKYQLRLWIAWVPSESNPADAPSRGRLPIGLGEAQQRKVDVGRLELLASGQI